MVSLFNHALKSRTVVLTSILALAFYLRLPFWTQPLDWDEGAHAYIGWAILQGLFPYTDIYNTKPPGIYLIHTLLFSLVEPSAISIKVFATIWTLFTAWFIFLMGKETLGEGAGYLSALLFAIFSSGPMIEGGGVNSEVFMNLPLVAGVYYFLLAEKRGDKRLYLLSGIFNGIAFSIKQVAGVNIILIGGFWFYQLIHPHPSLPLDPPPTGGWGRGPQTPHKGGRKKVGGGIKGGGGALYIIVGFIIPWIPILLFLAHGDAIPEFIYWVFTHSFSYVGHAYTETPSLAMFLETSPKMVIEDGLLWFFGLLACGWIVRKDREGKEVFLVLWFISSAIGASFGGRFFPHYFIQIIPPLAVLASYGILIVATGDIPFKRWARFVIIVLSMILSILWIRTDWRFYTSYTGDEISYHQNRNNLFVITRDIGHYIGKRTEPSDRIYVLGPDPGIYFTARRLSASRWIFPHEMRFYVGSGNPVSEIIADLRSHRPKYIVVILTTLEAFPEIKKVINEGYTLEIAGKGYAIFVSSAKTSGN